MAIDRERILDAAQKYVEKKRYDRAAIEYQKILQEDPNDARILLKLGDLQSRMESYVDAVATYDRVGQYYASRGFALKAVAVFMQIREIIAKHVPHLDERYSHIPPKLAELFQHLHLNSDALAVLDEVATRLQRQNRDAEAIDVFRKIVELDPTNPLPHLRLAEAFSRIKNGEAAVVEFGIASGQLLKLGRRDDALKVIDRLLAHRPDASHARIAAELYLARAGSNDGLQALAKLQICFQANPRDLDTLALLAKAFTQIGQAGKSIEVQKEMARIARDSGKNDLFRELLVKLQKLAPNDDGVRELAASFKETASEPAPPQSHEVPARPAVDLDAASAGPELEEPYEDVGDSDIESEEQAAHPAEDRDGGIVVEADIEVAEGQGERDEGDRDRDLIFQTLAEAADYRRGRQLSQAIESLRTGLRSAPRALELHEMLRDVLVEAGRVDDAVVEMIELARLLVEGLDGESAARTLQDALGIDPDNAEAARMLHDLGYELVEEPQLPSAVGLQAAEAPTAMRSRQGSYDPEAPLPSYDLEEIGPEDVAIRSYSDRALVAAQKAAMPQAAIDSFDDPFADPLPSFPLDPSSETSLAAPAMVAHGKNSAGRSASGSQRGIPELEAALEEADFFASRGLFDDARTIIQEQLVRLPSHPLLRDRLTDLDAQEKSHHGGSGTRISPAAAGDDRDFDIVESLNALEMPAGTGPSRTFGGAAEQVDVEEVFAKFKAGVAQQISVDDAQSHYDLGVAYKEMGLLDDAIREFDTSARDVKHACVCHSMIGMIHLERGHLNDAIDAFERGLQAPDRTKDQDAALNYEIASAYEAKKMTKQALDHFQRAARLAPTYRDVQERVRRLQWTEPKGHPSRAVAVGADDEFERVFDDILGREKP